VTFNITDRKRAITPVNCPSGLLLPHSTQMRRTAAVRISSAAGSVNEPGRVNNTTKRGEDEGEISKKTSWRGSPVSGRHRHDARTLTAPHQDRLVDTLPVQAPSARMEATRGYRLRQAPSG
jgi:hypothetical protein